MRVYPAPGLRVRDPATRQLVPDDGLEVSETDVTWARLLRDGDVTLDPPGKASAPPAKPAAVPPPAAAPLAADGAEDKA